MKNKDKGTLLQVLGGLILLGGLQGFFIFRGAVYFVSLAASIAIFVVCLSKGGALARKKE